MNNRDNPHGFDEATMRRIQALRRIRAANEARRTATREQIEAQGIRPNVDQMVNHMNGWKSFISPNPRRSEHTITTARRIYRFNTNHSGPGRDEGLDEDDEFDAEWEGILAEEGLQDLDPDLISQYREIARQRLRSLKKATAAWNAANKVIKPKPTIDLIASLCTASELINNVCKFLAPADIVNLYSVAKDFHQVLNQYMRSSVLVWARHMAPNAAQIYSSPTYSHWFIPDPAGRRLTMDDYDANRLQRDQPYHMEHRWLNQDIGGVRYVPGLVWLQRVVNREIRVRDIIATLARMGHRLPKGAQGALQKLWVIMDASTTATRLILMSKETFFTDEDVYIVQMFVIKLNLAFNDPVFGPRSGNLTRLMLGQKGLSPLWAFLRGKKYTTKREIRQLKIRYDVPPTPHQLQTGRPMWDIDIDQMGVVHLEGWGTGGLRHLMRPDELIPLEASRREMSLNENVLMMAIFGHVDLETGNPMVPDIDEMYMSDDELGTAQKIWTPLSHELANGGCGNVPFETKMWKPKHARKARWNTLTPEVKKDILEEEKEEMKQVKALDRIQDEYELHRHALKRLYAAASANGVNGRDFKIAKPDPERDWEKELSRLRISIRYPEASALSMEEIKMGVDLNLDDDAGKNMDEDVNEDVHDAMDVDMDPQPQDDPTPRRRMSKNHATNSQPSVDTPPTPQQSHRLFSTIQQTEEYDASPEPSEGSDNTGSASDHLGAPGASRVINTAPRPSQNTGNSEPSNEPEPQSSPSSSAEEDRLSDLDSDDLATEPIPPTFTERMYRHREQFRLLTPEALQYNNIGQLLGPAATDDEDERNPSDAPRPPSLSPTPELAPVPDLSSSSPSSVDSQDRLPFDAVAGRNPGTPRPHHFYNEQEDEEEEDEDDQGDVDSEGYWVPPEHRNMPIPPPPVYGPIPRLPSPSFLEQAAPERTTMTEQEISEALIAQADMKYDSELEAEFDSDKEDKGIDWRDFLNNPRKYLVRMMEEEDEPKGVREENEGSGDGNDGDGDGDGNEDAEEQFDWAHVDADELPGGGSATTGQCSLAQGPDGGEEDEELKGMDEDEKRHRRKLMKWYRPW